MKMYSGGCFTKISSSSGNEAAKELVKSAKNGKHNGLRSPNSGEEVNINIMGEYEKYKNSINFFLLVRFAMHP